MMGHVRKAIMKLTFVIIVIAVTFVTVSCSSQKKGTAYSVYFLNEDGTSLTEGRVYIESQDAVTVAAVLKFSASPRILNSYRDTDCQLPGFTV